MTAPISVRGRASATWQEETIDIRILTSPMTNYSETQVLILHEEFWLVIILIKRDLLDRLPLQNVP